MSEYYDGNKLLSLADLDGEPPEIYICTSNRAAGKTTYFGRYAMRRFLNYDEKFILVYRFAYELENVADKFFKDLQALFFPDYTMESKKKGRAAFATLYIQKGGDEKQICGYAVALNSADQLKKFSHFFSDCARMIFDEFQSETWHYCADEVKKLQSVHATVARGHGQQARRVPVIMIANPVSAVNPYYIALGISARLEPNAHFIRGHGWVLEQGHNEAAENAMKTSRFAVAFSSDSYADYAADGRYLDNNAFIMPKPPQLGRCLLVIKHGGSSFGVFQIAEKTGAFLYVSESYDKTCPVVLAATVADHYDETVMRSVPKLATAYDAGCVRFSSLVSRAAFLALIGIRGVQ